MSGIRNIPSLAGTTAVLLLATAQALGQQAAQSTPPNIQVGGTAEITVPPDRASFTVTITSRGTTAATVSADNAKLVGAVKASMQQAGLLPEEILRTQFRTNPRWNYDSSLFRSRRSGFEAEYTISIRTANLQHVGACVDAALEGGATQVSTVEFDLANPTAVKQRALANAVANAHANAETIAVAAGGRLGSLLEMRTGSVTGNGRGVLEEVVLTANRSRSSPDVDVDVNPSDVIVSANVVGQWQFVERAAN